jgi:hypothetical protein
VPYLLTVLLARLSLPPTPFVPLAWHDLATLTDAEARQLAGRRAWFRVVVEGQPAGDEKRGWRYDCEGDGARTRLGIPLPDRNRWSAGEDDLVRRLLPKVAAARTGRSLKAVYERRRALRLPDRRANNGRGRRTMAVP